MLTNATILSSSLPAISAAGARVYPAPRALSIRCAMVDVTDHERRMLGNSITDATALLYLLAGSGLSPAKGMQLSVQVDDAAAILYRIVYVRTEAKAGGLSHQEIYLQEVF